MHGDVPTASRILNLSQAVPLFQIQLLSVSAGSSVSATGGCGPRGFDLGWPHERAKLTTKVTTFLSKIKNDGLKALLYLALNEGFI